MGGCGVRINVVKGYKKSMGKRGLGCTRRRREAAVARLDEEEEWEVWHPARMSAPYCGVAQREGVRK